MDQDHLLTHWSWDEIGNISQTTILNAFSFNENVWILIKLSLKFVVKHQINNIPVLPDNGLALARGQAIIWAIDGQHTDTYMGYWALTN